MCTCIVQQKANGSLECSVVLADIFKSIIELICIIETTYTMGYNNNLTKGKLTRNKTPSHYLKNVMRIELKDKISIFNIYFVKSVILRLVNSKCIGRPYRNIRHTMCHCEKNKLNILFVPRKDDK